MFILNLDRMQFGIGFFCYADNNTFASDSVFDFGACLILTDHFRSYNYPGSLRFVFMVCSWRERGRVLCSRFQQ